MVLRYAPGDNPNGSLDDIAGVINEAGNVVRPDAPPRARRGPADRSATGSACSLARVLARWRRRMSAAAAEGAQRAVALGLTVDEYELILARSAASRRRSSSRCSSCCGRSTAPTSTPSRCCATLPTEGPRLVLGPGENAGAVDVGGGLAVAFKVESHNHPSAVEPFQGAATGVGGILRDIFAVGARPIAILDSLRFGEPTSERSRYLLDRAVAGIGHYGNSIGVPTVGGESTSRPPTSRTA